MITIGKRWKYGIDPLGSEILTQGDLLDTLLFIYHASQSVYNDPLAQKVLRRAFDDVIRDYIPLHSTLKALREVQHYALSNLREKK
jgi:hypothetical protein